jgi:hypothetical protein
MYRKATAGTSHFLDGFGPYRADLLRLRFGRTKIYSGSWCARASGYVCVATISILQVHFFRSMSYSYFNPILRLPGRFYISAFGRFYGSTTPVSLPFVLPR